MEYCMAFEYFALQAGSECRCGNAYGTAEQYVKVGSDECDGGYGMDYGAGWRNAVFRNKLYTEPPTEPI